METKRFKVEFELLLIGDDEPKRSEIYMSGESDDIVYKAAFPMLSKQLLERSANIKGLTILSVEEAIQLGTTPLGDSVTDEFKIDTDTNNLYLPEEDK
jgi:hypothetical protein